MPRSSFSPALSETASRNACVRACGQWCTVIAARLPVSLPACSTCRSRCPPPPSLSIFIVALSLAAPNARAAPSGSDSSQSCRQLHRRRRIVASLQSFIARQTPRLSRFMADDFNHALNSHSAATLEWTRSEIATYAAAPFGYGQLTIKRAINTKHVTSICTATIEYISLRDVGFLFNVNFLQRNPKNASPSTSFRYTPRI